MNNQESKNIYKLRKDGHASLDAVIKTQILKLPTGIEVP